MNYIPRTKPRWHWQASAVLFLGLAAASGAARAETPDEAKSRIAKEHEECLSLHKNDPRAQAQCETAAADKEKSHHQKSVEETKALFGEKLSGDALKAAIELEKHLGKPLDHTLVVEAAKQVPLEKLHAEVSAKIKAAAAELEAKVKPLVEPHAKDISDDLAKWAKAEQEKQEKSLEKFKDNLDKQAEKHHWSKAEIDKRLKAEKAGLERRFQQDLMRKLDAEFRKYEKGLDKEIADKADEISAAEKAVWLPKIEAGVGGKTKVDMAALAPVRDRLWEHTAIQRHYGKPMVRALLRAAVFKALETDIRKQANV